MVNLQHQVMKAGPGIIGKGVFAVDGAFRRFQRHPRQKEFEWPSALLREERQGLG
jgi:hypothetical protein